MLVPLWAASTQAAESDKQEDNEEVHDSTAEEIDSDNDSSILKGLDEYITPGGPKNEDLQESEDIEKADIKNENNTANGMNTDITGPGQGSGMPNSSGDGDNMLLPININQDDHAGNNLTVATDLNNSPQPVDLQKLDNTGMNNTDSTGAEQGPPELPTESDQELSEQELSDTEEHEHKEQELDETPGNDVVVSIDANQRNQTDNIGPYHQQKNEYDQTDNIGPHHQKQNEYDHPEQGSEMLNPSGDGDSHQIHDNSSAASGADVYNSQPSNNIANNGGIGLGLVCFAALLGWINFSPMDTAHTSPPQSTLPPEAQTHTATSAPTPTSATHTHTKPTTTSTKPSTAHLQHVEEKENNSKLMFFIWLILAILCLGLWATYRQRKS